MKDTGTKTSNVIGSLSSWRADLNLVAERREEKTVLTENRHYGPLCVQKPFYPEGPEHAHIYVLHPPGGVVSGDSLRLTVTVGQNAAILVTTPGASRFYRARHDMTSQRAESRLLLQPGAALEWFPQETIVFDQARVEINTHITLSRQAKLAAWEITSLGLPAGKKPFRKGYISQKCIVELEGRPIFADVMRFDQICGNPLKTMTGMRGAGTTGFCLVGPFEAFDDTNHRQKILSDCAVNLPAPQSKHWSSVTTLGNFFLGRYLGNSAEMAKQIFTSWWRLLRPRLLHRQACTPRIWLT